ncbi:MAG: ubiquitin family protein [Anaerolineae bacterium]
MIEVSVELLGIARRLAGIKNLSMELSERATHHDVLRRLAEMFPTLVGMVIDARTLELLPAFVLNQNGRRAISDSSTPVESGECLVLMFVESGG